MEIGERERKTCGTNLDKVASHFLTSMGTEMQLAEAEGPVVDVVSGRGYLAEQLARKPGRHVVLTDFSPRVLRRNRRYFEFLGLYENVSLVACDARRLPFRDRTVEVMTTNLGLPNIEAPGDLLTELQRVLREPFYAICHLLPPEDTVNRKVIREYGVETFLYKDSEFARAGFQVEVTNVCRGLARPTPESRLIPGARIDALPVAEIELTSCTLAEK